MNLVAADFFCSVLEEHDESSRMPVCTWVCALSFGRCRMSKFFLLVYLDFFEPLRRSLLLQHDTQRQHVAQRFETWTRPDTSRSALRRRGRSARVMPARH